MKDERTLILRLRVAGELYRFCPELIEAADELEQLHSMVALAIPIIESGDGGRTDDVFHLLARMKRAVEPAVRLGDADEKGAR